MNNFAKNLRIIRNNLKISQKEIADAIGRTTSSVNNWERGKGEPTITDLINVAKFLKVPIYTLIGEETTVEERIYKSNQINKLRHDLFAIKSYLSSIEKIVNSPENLNISEFRDTGKQRVPKKQFRDNIKSTQKNNIMFIKGKEKI